MTSPNASNAVHVYFAHQPDLLNQLRNFCQVNKMPKAQVMRLALVHFFNSCAQDSKLFKVNQ